MKNENSYNFVPHKSESHMNTELALIQWNIIFWIAVIVLFSTAIHSVITKGFEPEQFIYLAKNFSKGNLSIDDMPLIYPDYVVLNGHTYLPLGPLPAILLIPFSLLLDFGLQAGWISILFTILNIFLLYRLLSFATEDSETLKWMLLLFFGGTVYYSVSIIAISWYFSHVIATTFLLLSLISVWKKNLLMSGFFLGLAAACRFSILFALPGFIFAIWGNFFTQRTESIFTPDKTQSTFKFIEGLFLPLLFLFLYNFARFGNIFETGYKIAVVGSQELEIARRYGLFSIIHIPRNLFFLLFQGPLPYPSLNSPVFTFPFLQPSPLGMGIFFTSPALFFAFKASIKNLWVQTLWIGVGAILIPLLSYYGTGWIQFGFRYSLDFMPFLILLTTLGVRSVVNNKVRLMIILSVIINLWGTAWLYYWLS